MRDDFNFQRKNIDDYIYEVGVANSADLDDILSILRPNWHRIYQQSISQDALDRFVEQTLRPHYAGILNGHRADRTLHIARTKSGMLCGFTCFGMKDGVHEIQAIYVSPSHHKRSIGAMLVLSASDEMVRLDRKTRKFMPVQIRICTDNEGAKNFANKLEGTILKTEERHFMDAVITDQIIGWRNARALNNCLRRKFSNSMNDAPEQIYGGREIFPASGTAPC
jgi:GNAT superfamily N-acetyltransferase